jgi:arginase
MTYGQPFVGTDSGPKLLREAGLRNMMSALGWRVEDLPDLDFDSLQINSNDSYSYQGNARNHELVGKGAKMLADLVEEKLRMNRFPLILGGDHSIGIGSLAGVLRVKPNTGVLWIDAHADLNTPSISESGNMHGMPVGLLMDGVAPGNEHDESIPGLEWLKENPKLKSDSLVYVGLRDVDPAERKLIQSLGIAAYTMHDIDRYGIGQVMDMALDHLLHKDPDRPLHLSYDIDAVDPHLAPATGTTVRGGLTYREAHFVAEAVARSGNLASAEIVELNPNLSCDNGADETVELGLQIITSFMGKSII